MKQYRNLRTSLLTMCAAVLIMAPTTALLAETANQLKVGVINFKDCVENSKMGKDEQASFEALKKQAEQVLQDKEKQLREFAAKIEDADYLDSLTADAEAELKHKFRYLNQELSQQQQSLYQTLSQANYKIVQKLQDEVQNAAKNLAAEKKLDLVINNDSCFFYDNALDVTQEVIKKMDTKSTK